MLIVTREKKTRVKIHPIINDINKKFFLSVVADRTWMRSLCKTVTGSIVTAPLRFGKTFDLLGLAFSKDQIIVGALDKHTVIDPLCAIDQVYFKVNDVLYVVSLSDEPGNIPVIDNLDDVWQATFDFTLPPVKAVERLAPYFNVANDHGVDVPGEFTFKITGSVQLSRGITHFDAQVVDKTEGLDVELLGYTLQAYYSEK